MNQTGVAADGLPSMYSDLRQPGLSQEPALASHLNQPGQAYETQSSSTNLNGMLCRLHEAVR